MNERRDSMLRSPLKRNAKAGADPNAASSDIDAASIGGVESDARVRIARGQLRAQSLREPIV
jgi:hypothetical protein